MSAPYQLFNVDSSLAPLTEAEVNAAIIDARVSMLSFKNFDFMEKRLHFVLECVTYTHSYWLSLAKACDQSFTIRRDGSTILVFPQTVDCGCIRTYRFRPSSAGRLPHNLTVEARALPNEEALYELLDTLSARQVFDAWHQAKTKATDLPTEFVEGRMTNTSVDRAMIITRGDGCVVCGTEALSYAATTIGDAEHAVMVQLPVCSAHLAEAKSHPSTFAFLASLFHLSYDWGELEKLPHIPDALVPSLHTAVAEELGTL
jgi:hypothetical protein